MANIRYDLPDDLHWNLKRRAADERMSLKDLVVKALRYYLEKSPSPAMLFDSHAEKQNVNRKGEGHGR
jgi:hypothetical protein